MLGGIEHRGNHASGLAIANADGSEVFVHKMPEPAWSFMKHKATEAFLEEHLEGASIVLTHTRHATVGNPADNKNNHPMFDGMTAVIHNGSIRNHDTLAKSEGVDLVCETDSDIFRAIFDKEGFTPEAARTLSKAGGSAAIAAISPIYPGVLALGRSGNPIVYGEANDKFYFASEMQAIHAAVRAWEKGRSGLWMRAKSSSLRYHTMQDDTIYYIGNTPEELTHHELKICTYFQPPVYRAHETYAEKMKQWRVPNKPTRIYTNCIKCGLTQHKHESTPWRTLVCGNKKCANPFAYMEEKAAA